MAEGHAALDAHIRRLRELDKLGERAAPKVAKALERELEANIRAGVGPDGTPWPATEDGHTPLQGAVSSLSVRAIGSVVVARISGIHARHHIGNVRGGVRRPILPSKRIPEPVTRAIAAVLDEEFARTMGGER
jgi:hypothetical protein